MDTMKRYFDMIFRSRLIMTSSGRTMVKLPIWIAVILAFNNIKLAVVAAIAVVGLGMHVSVEKG